MSMASWDASNRPVNERGAGGGWEAITDPFALMMSQLYDAPEKYQEPGTHTWSYQGNIRRSGYGGQPGLAPPPPGTGKFSFSGSGGGATGGSTSAGTAGGGGAYTLPETLTPISTSGSTAGLTAGISAPAATAGGAATGAGSITVGAGGAAASPMAVMMKYGGMASSLASGYSAYAQQKAQAEAAKRAGQPSTTESSRSPYANEYIRALIPYILQEAQSVYESRASRGKRKAGTTLPGTNLSIYDILAGLAAQSRA